MRFIYLGKLRLNWLQPSQFILKQLLLTLFIMEKRSRYR
jgi:hypothetical protein